MPLHLDPDSDQTRTFAGLLEAIYAQRFTGEVPLVLHCHNGVVKGANVVVQSAQIRFDLPSAPPPRLDIPVD